MKKYISTLGLFLFSTGWCMVANAQQLNLNQGDEYQITTAMSSTMAMKRGDKQIDLKSMSTVTKAYKVTQATNDGYTVAITTKHIADTLDAFNQKLAYNSNRAAEAGSDIETTLSKMVGETHTINLDKSGKITQVADPAKATASAQAASTAGVYSKLLANGVTLNFGSSFKLPEGAKTGTTWKEEKSSGNATSKLSLKVEDMTVKTTKISFTGEQSEPGINTNLNGILLIDNATGVVMERVIKTATSSKESSEGKTYVVSRRSTIAEVCNKVK